MTVCRLAGRWLAVVAVVFCWTDGARGADWQHWRGPTANGIAAEGQTPPTEWSETKNVVWKAAVPGRGHSSPIIVGDKVILTTADEGRQTQSVLCFDRETGKSLWETEISQGGFPKVHKKNTHATPTPACDGERIYATFCHHGGVELVVLDLDGKKLGSQVVGPYRPQAFEYGYAPSPLLYDSLVIVASEFENNGFIAAFDRQSGRRAWIVPRNGISYSSPIVANIGGKDQLLISGYQHVASYDPRTGKPQWAASGTAQATCGTAVWEGDLVFASGGYPQKNTVAVRGDGSGQVVWQNNEKCYEQSMLAHDGYLYAVNDNGIAFCWDAKTGKEQWKSRLGGPVSASLILAGGNLYYSDERGTTYVFAANPEKFTKVAENRLGSESFATATIVDSRIYLRVAEGSGGGRQESLYCIGAK